MSSWPETGRSRAAFSMEAFPSPWGEGQGVRGRALSLKRSTGSDAPQRIAASLASSWTLSPPHPRPFSRGEKGERPGLHVPEAGRSPNFSTQIPTSPQTPVKTGVHGFVAAPLCFGAGVPPWIPAFAGIFGERGTSLEGLKQGGHAQHFQSQTFPSPLGEGQG